MKGLVFVLLVSVSATLAVAVTACDVVVIGAGAAGTVAALQAGRAGAKTVLVERGFQVGGDMTTGGVNFPGLFHAWGRQVIDGCGYELVTNAVAHAGGTLPDFTQPTGKRHWLHQITVNAPLYVLLAEEALEKAGVELRYHTAPLSVVRDGDGWTLELVSPGERQTLRAKCVIDATGDGAAAALAGARRMREATTSPGSFNYVIDPHVDLAKLDFAALDRAYDAAVACGELQPGDKRWPMKSYLGGKGGVGNYVPDADSSTTARRIRTNRAGRAALLRMYRFLRRQPGLEKLELVAMSPEVGVRETYRVEGDYVLTHEDYVSGREFPDAVAYAFYPIDLHDKSTGVQPKHLAEGKVARVPLAALTVKGLRDFLAVGRCMSADRLANAALRVQATCMATGQAAGEAAALAAKLGCDVRKVPLDELKRRLAATGHIVP